MTQHIAVLMGGWSAEREVSLSSGEGVVKALTSLGYRVTAIDVKPDVAEVLARVKPDVAFNALHGRFGEDGCIQGVLETLGIPYTHSGVLASALGMDKPMAKHVFQSVGLRVPKGKVVSREELLKGNPMKRPYVVKPVNEGSSVGVQLMVEGETWAVDGDHQLDHSPSTIHHSHYLVEEYIPGRELTAAVLADRALGVTELRCHTGFYDYTNKYTGGKTEHLCPAPVHADIYRQAMEMALAAHRALGCRGLTRSDFRYDDTKGEPGTLYLLEINTQPGMTPLSLSPELAAHAGIDYPALVDMLVRLAQLDGEAPKEVAWPNNQHVA